MSTSTFIDRDQLVAMLDNYDHHTFVSIESETTPKINKGTKLPQLFVDKFNCDVSEVRKVSQFVCMIGLDYKHVIETRLQKEGKNLDEYEAGETWHEAVPFTKNLRQHKSTKEIYVWLFCVANNEPTSAYYDMKHGIMLDESELTPYLPAKSTPTNQGLTEGNEVIPRTFKLSSIRKITIDKETYLVR
jgi:hypothetical protein